MIKPLLTAMALLLVVPAFAEGVDQDYHDIVGSPAISFSPTKHQGSNESFLCVVKGGRWTVVQAEAWMPGLRPA